MKCGHSKLGRQRFILAREGHFGTLSAWHAKDWQLAETILVRECVSLLPIRYRVKRRKIFCDVATTVARIETCSDAKLPKPHRHFCALYRTLLRAVYSTHDGLTRLVDLSPFCHERLWLEAVIVHNCSGLTSKCEEARFCYCVLHGERNNGLASPRTTKTMA